MSIVDEVARLEHDRALGPPQHRRQVLDKMAELRTALTDCVFALACQARLSRNDCLHVLRFLQSDVTMAADDTVDDVAIALLMGLLYCFDVHLLEQRPEEGEC